jgi:hypothetical protein
MPFFGGQDISPTFQNLAFAHRAGSTAPAGRRQEQFALGQGAEKRGSSSHVYGILCIPVNDDLDIPAIDQFGLGVHQHKNQQKDHPGKGQDGIKNDG